MSKGGLEVTAITIEAGWKMTTLLAEYSALPQSFSFAPADPAALVSQTIQIAQNESDLVQQLNIIGHGSASGVEIGSHFVELSNFDDYDKQFQKLRQVLSGESFVFIRGCVVGQNEKLMVRFAKAFSVCVYAGTSAENSLLPFNTGDYVVAYPGGGVYATKRP